MEAVQTYIESSPLLCFFIVALVYMGIHIHCRFGLLSGLCGATVAGTGSACGLVYLMGGNVTQIGYAVNNMLGDVTGMLCDGAKADCALKISTCVNTAFQCAFMDKVPGIYGFLGSRDRAKGYVYSNHHEKYTVDESTLKRGAAVYAQFAIDFLEANA